MGQKNFKGTVSIINDSDRIRLRWRYQKRRYSLNLFAYSKANLLEAKKTALMIEQDIVAGQLDVTLYKYKYGSNGKSKIQNVVVVEAQEVGCAGKSLVQLFERWTKDYKQRDCGKDENYFRVRNMLKRWNNVSQSDILSKLNATTISAKTYNRRLGMLKQFTKWLVKKAIWLIDPLEDVDTKRTKKVVRAERKSLTVDEIKRILKAFKEDTFCPKSSASKHSHFYPFIYFIFKTGVRNAEAIGLRVSSVDFDSAVIHIKEVLARTLNKTNASARVRKETKNGKERVLPITKDLKKILLPLTVDKTPDDLVFKSFTGMAIDDRMFQRRIYKKVLKGLGIEERVLYACRHTFGSRCLNEGLTPLATAFLMGNNPETLLRTYTHQIELPKKLPSI